MYIDLQERPSELVGEKPEPLLVWYRGKLCWGKDLQGAHATAYPLLASQGPAALPAAPSSASPRDNQLSFMLGSQQLHKISW